MRKSHDETRGDRAAECAARFGCSRATVFRDAAFAEALDRLSGVLGPDFKARVLDSKAACGRQPSPPNAAGSGQSQLPGADAGRAR